VHCAILQRNISKSPSTDYKRPELNFFSIKTFPKHFIFPLPEVKGCALEMGDSAQIWYYSIRWWYKNFILQVTCKNLRLSLVDIFDTILYTFIALIGLKSQYALLKFTHSWIR